MITKGKISVITVNYNESDTTLALIGDLKRQEIAGIEIIVVDNSSDVMAQVPPSENMDYILIRTDNQGYAAALNLGVRKASCNYILLLNNDILLPEGSVECLLECLEENTGFSAVSPVLRTQANNEIEFAGFTKINPFTGRNKRIRKTSNDNIAPTPYLHGACMLVEKEAWKKTGGLPEIYFLYYEEIEWSVRLSALGYKLGVAQHCNVTHHQSLTISTIKEKAYYYLQRNRILFQRRNATYFQLIIFSIYLVVVSVPMNIIRNLLTGRLSFLREYIRAITWNLTHPIQPHDSV